MKTVAFKKWIITAVISIIFTIIFLIMSIISGGTNMLEAYSNSEVHFGDNAFLYNFDNERMMNNGWSFEFGDDGMGVCNFQIDASSEGANGASASCQRTANS